MTSVAARSSNSAHDNEEKATIYVRNYAKKAIMLVLPSKVKLSELKEKIFNKMRIPK